MDVLELEENYIAPTYNRQPLTLVKGDGVKVWDERGNEYLDFVAGIAVCSLGHTHPAVTEALIEQAKNLIHVSNLYHIVPQAELGQALAGVTPDSIQKFFFCNSGTEAVEAALKLAVKHTGREKVVALEGSFHGRTSAAVSTTWKESYRAPFDSLVSMEPEFVPFDDIEKAKETVDGSTAAFIAEPVQGEGGINVSSEDFLPALRDICDDNEVPLILDEVQAGMCRTGEWFSCDHWDVEPDIITMAKALGNGFPIGSMGARAEIMDSFSPGDHASTFGGNPLACAVSKAVVETMEREEVPAHVREVGGYFKEELEELSDAHGSVKDVRGLGLMLGIELEDDDIAGETLDRAREDGFLINITSGNVLRFVPPLIIEKKHIDSLIEELDQILEELE